MRVLVHLINYLIIRRSPTSQNPSFNIPKITTSGKALHLIPSSRHLGQLNISCYRFKKSVDQFQLHRLLTLEISMEDSVDRTNKTRLAVLSDRPA